MSTGLRVTDLSVAYRRRKNVLNSVSVGAERGAITALIGVNGSGKSTFLHALLGLIPISTGSIEFDGVPLKSQQRWNVGFCADDLPLPELLTGAEFVRVMTSLRGVDLQEDVLAAFFVELNMDGAQLRLMKEYSHGMKRKVQLLANVLHSPDLLVLDEPFRGLDQESHLTLLNLLQAYTSSDRVVLLSTHDLSLAAQISGRAVRIDAGTAVVVPPEEIALIPWADDESAASDRPQRFADLLSALEDT